MRENEKLKKQLQELNKTECSKPELSKNKNSLLSFLIMLGMLFLLTASKGHPKTHRNIKAPLKLHKSDHELYSAEEQFRVIEDGQRAFKEVERMGELVGSEQILKGMMRKLDEMKASVKDVAVPKALKREFNLLKREVS